MLVFIAANENAMPDPARKNYQISKSRTTKTEKMYTYKNLVPDWWSPYFFAEKFNFTRSRQLLTERRESRRSRFVGQKARCAGQSMTWYTAARNKTSRRRRSKTWSQGPSRLQMQSIPEHKSQQRTACRFWFQGILSGANLPQAHGRNYY